MNTIANYPTTSPRQRGSALFIALIALVTMTLAGIALVRSVDTANLMAGNFAFRQATLQASDVGVETAVSALNIIVTTSLDANWPAPCAVGACNYYPTQQPDTNGVPNVIGNWATVPAITPPISPDYEVKYVIDRLCQGTPPITNVAGDCYAFAPAPNCSKNSGAICFSSSQTVYYRVTVHVKGPRNTVSMAQVVLNR